MTRTFGPFEMDIDDRQMKCRECKEIAYIYFGSFTETPNAHYLTSYTTDISKPLNGTRPQCPYCGSL